MSSNCRRKIWPAGTTLQTSASLPIKDNSSRFEHREQRCAWEVQDKAGILPECRRGRVAQGHQIVGRWGGYLMLADRSAHRMSLATSGPCPQPQCALSRSVSSSRCRSKKTALWCLTRTADPRPRKHVAGIICDET